jgi:hypothetical protein
MRTSKSSMQEGSCKHDRAEYVPLHCSIISVTTNQIYTNKTYGTPPANAAEFQKSQRPKDRSGSSFSSWFLFFLKVTGLVFFCVFAFSAWVSEHTATSVGSILEC